MRMQDMASPAVERLPKRTVMALPIAAMEQHGHHLPLFTDSLLLEEVVRRAEERLGDKAVFAPLLWLGNSHHHLDHAGTLSASPRAYLDVLNDLLDNLISHGFERIVFLNGHGGNIVPSAQAVFETRQRHRSNPRLLLLSATYWSLGEPGSDMTSLVPNLIQDRMGHACEWETSMILRIRPELVGDFSSLDSVDIVDPYEPASRGWIMPDRSRIGHIGHPSEATPEKGEALFQVFADNMVRWIEKVASRDPSGPSKFGF